MELRPVQRWEWDKPHRCPECYAVAIDLERPKSYKIYTCCQCSARFTRWPRLERWLPDVGVRCQQHTNHPANRGVNA